ncbi:hypothetical protein K4A83_13715 [Spirulina subsalsa FACHB-351]|uniref:Uncharacterized protein n=1 Tax=Spirulina subsalsa FACHB-351 TaxID=234711 RepID=A0ABT3L748_9CYAN|nr:hypothetical protein [Spirulina subsalsa]MCW6037320.1 hypothetical protein [Spirulina subsalsa FACHB-351]
MAQLSNAPLKENPFTSYRDIETGEWRIVYPMNHGVNRSGTHPVSTQGVGVSRVRLVSNCEKIPA